MGIWLYVLLFYICSLKCGNFIYLDCTQYFVANLIRLAFHILENIFIVNEHLPQLQPQNYRVFIIIIIFIFVMILRAHVTKCQKEFCAAM